MSHPIGQTPTSRAYGIFGGKTLPRSCIESALHVIQCINNENVATPWINENTTTDGVGVWAVFGNRMICVSRVTHLTNVLSERGGVTDFINVNTHLRLGRGIALGNSKEAEKKFNMHFGAVLSGNITKMNLLDLSEDGPVINVALTSGNLVTANSTDVIQKFRSGGYEDPKIFSVGLLISQNDKEFAVIKKCFAAEDIVDEP